MSSGYLYKVFLIYTFRDVLPEAKSLMGTYVFSCVVDPQTDVGVGSANSQAINLRTRTCNF